MTKRKLLIFFLRRRALVFAVLLIQIALFFFLIAGTEKYFNYSYMILNILSIAVCVNVLNKYKKAAYKTTWIFLILLFPFFGGIMYILFRTWSNPKKLRKALEYNIHESEEAFYLAGNRLTEFTNKYPEFRTQSKYLQNFARYPVYANTRQEYLDSGEIFFQRVIEELEKAQNYIFVESFILCEGIMLNSIIAILEKKASQGLDVRVMYDDLGCFLTIPPDYDKILMQKGIKTFIFNPFRPIVSSLQNNRDHRKIISIDGKVAFTGGINLADEYINAIDRFGHWKDAAIMLEGEGAWSLTLIFLQMWNLNSKTADDYASYYPWKNSETFNAAPVQNADSWGYVQPYADNPIDDENVGEHVYIQIINQAKKYIYINTPYLVIDDNLMSALTLAAKSGVDVRIITPHRWDRWFLAATSRSYYRRLIYAGVKVYEYTSGFNHGKIFVSDDKIASVGTNNLDFRSLYLHFECGVLIYSSEIIKAIKNDFLRTIPISQKVTYNNCTKNSFQRLLSDLLRIFAPLM
jgi:cardiolipin synthase